MHFSQNISLYFWCSFWKTIIITNLYKRLLELRKGSNIHLPMLELFSHRVYNCVEKSWLGILMQCGMRDSIIFMELGLSNVRLGLLMLDNVLILEMNRADMQPKIIYFNKACEVWKSKAKVIPSGPGRV